MPAVVGKAPTRLSRVRLVSWWNFGPRTRKASVFCFALGYVCGRCSEKDYYAARKAVAVNGKVSLADPGHQGLFVKACFPGHVEPHANFNMDKLPPLGTAVSATAPQTVAIYAPLLQANKQNIESTKSKTFSFGPHPRQELDVYFPSKPGYEDGPILFFVYGGGLVRGGKKLPNSLAHANVGHFFAESLGFTTVIPDYRLLSHGAQFPSGGEDIALAVDWVASNLSGELNSGGSGKPRDLFIMGNSAGGVHLSAFLFAPALQESRAKVLRDDSQLRFRGAVFLSVPFHFIHAVPERAEVLQTYYVSPDGIADHSAFGLLKSLAQKDTSELSRYGILILSGELDPEDEILIPKNDFVATLGTVLNARFTVEVMRGQNHISPPFSLGTGIAKEEAWGWQVGRWINYITASV